MKKRGRNIAWGLLCLVVFLSAAVSTSLSAEVTLQWDPNTESHLAGYYIYFKTETCCEPYNGSGSPVKISLDAADPDYKPNFDPAAPEYTLTGLTDGKIHYFVVTAFDTAGNESGYSNEVNTRGPEITAQPTVTHVSNDAATIEWSTDQAATSEVRYNTTADPWGLEDSAVQSDAALVTTHSATLTDLEGDTTYYFQVGSTNETGFGPDAYPDTVDNNPSATQAFTTESDPDTTPPSFLIAPAVTQITDTSAVIEWTTSEPATAVLAYGTSTAYGLEESITQYQTETSLVLNGLDAETTYYFKVQAADEAGNLSIIVNDQFTTETAPDVDAPVFTAAPTVSDITNASAVVTWETNENSTSVIQYGSASNWWGNYPSQKESLTYTKVHSMNLTGLAGETTYYVRAGSVDTAGNGPAISAELSFTTLENPDVIAPQIIAPPTVVAKTDTTATIVWETDESANSQVHYDTAGGSKAWSEYSFVKNDAALRLQHSITLTGLTPSTPYYFRVGSTDAAGNGPDTSTMDNNPSSEVDFSTDEEPDTAAPQIISPPTITAKDNRTLTIEWRTDEPSSSQVQYDVIGDRNWADYAESYLDTQPKTQHRVVLTNLSGDTRYYVRVGGMDAAGNGPDTDPDDNNPSTEITTLTDPDPDVTPPQISAPPTVTAKTNHSAVIEWSTDEPGNSLVQYGPGTSTWGNYPSSKNDGGMVTLHSITLTDLTGETTYYLRVGSADAAGNGPQISQELTFKTYADPDTTPPRITSPPTVTGITENSAIIEWQTDEPGNSLLRFVNDETDRTYQWTELASTRTDSAMVTNHSLTLTGLTPATRYHFMVGSTDAAGNGPDPTVEDANNPFTEDTFRTQAPPDEAAPRILPGTLVVGAISDRSAIVEWQTDEPSNSMVKFGTQEQVESVVGGSTWEKLPRIESDMEMKTRHRVTLAGLNPDTAYVYRCGSTDALGNGPDLNEDPTNASTMGLFTTVALPDTQAPEISNVRVVKATHETALILWQTDEPANSMVEYGPSKAAWGSFPFSESDADMQTFHSVTITNLTPDTEYHYRVGATDAAGNGPATAAQDVNPSTDLTFRTDMHPDRFAPQIMSSVTISAITDTSAVVAWETDEPGNSQVQYGTEISIWGNYEFSENDAEMTTNHRVTITGLAPGTRYYVRVSSTDASGNNHASSAIDRNPSIEYTLETAQADAPSIVAPGDADYAQVYHSKVNFSNHTIDITYDETNIKNAREESAYIFSPPLVFLEPGNSIEEISGGTTTDDQSFETYRFYFDEIPAYTIIHVRVNETVVDADDYPVSPNSVLLNDNDGDALPDDWEIEYGLNPESADEDAGEGKGGDFDLDGTSNYIEFLNGSDPKDPTSILPVPQFLETVPHDGAGLQDGLRVSNMSSFSVLIVEPTVGMDLTYAGSVEMTIDDGMDVYQVNLGDTDVVRSIKLNADEPDTAVSAVWVAYDRTMDGSMDPYPYSGTIRITVRAENAAGDFMQQVFSFKIESELAHDLANDPVNLPPSSSLGAGDSRLADVNAAAGKDVYNAGLEIQSGGAESMKIIYHTSDPQQPRFGPDGELPAFSYQGAAPVGEAVNLQPPTAFSTPVQLMLPVADPKIRLKDISVFLFDGQNWVLACDEKGNLSEDAYGWMVPESRRHYPKTKTEPAAIGIQVYHFTGVQLATMRVEAGQTSGSDDDAAQATCFVNSALKELGAWLNAMMPGKGDAE